MLIRPPGGPQDHQAAYSAMLPVVRDMHDTSGLWDACRGDEAWDLAQADTALARWVREHVGDGQVPLAGSGVGHLDLPFVKVKLPSLATRLTYWPVDFGNVRRSFELAGRADVVHLDVDVYAKPHRGLADVELHVVEARRYLGLLAGVELEAAVELQVPAL